MLSLILWLSSASETTLTLFNAKQARTDGRTDRRDEREGDDACERARLRGSSRLTAAAGGTYLIAARSLARSLSRFGSFVFVPLACPCV
jgi:hypothetical protein